MSDEYLLKEYELNYAQLRYYDDRQSATLTYLFSLTSAVATAEFAVLKFLEGATPTFYTSQAFLSVLVFIATVLLYMAMLQNRLYFVFTARQLNAIRGHLMSTAAADFTGNQLYTSTDFPALKPRSVHTFQLVGASLISALFAGSAVYALLPALGSPVSVWWTGATTVVVFLAEVAGGMVYLHKSGQKSADAAIHGSKRV